MADYSPDKQNNTSKNTKRKSNSNQNKKLIKEINELKEELEIKDEKI